MKHHQQFHDTHFGEVSVCLLLTALQTFTVTSHQRGMHRGRKSSSTNQQNTTSEQPVSQWCSLANLTIALLLMGAVVLIICRSEAYVASPVCWWWCRTADVRAFESPQPHRSPTILHAGLFNSSSELWLRCLERCGGGQVAICQNLFGIPIPVWILGRCRTFLIPVILHNVCFMIMPPTYVTKKSWRQIRFGFVAEGSVPWGGGQITVRQTL